MDTSSNRTNDPLADNLPAYRRGTQFGPCADATGYCFAAAVVFAFLIAGVIVYRTGNEEIIRTAANDAAPAAAQADPLQPPPIIQAR
jgi:hypothetical protein